MRNLVMDSQILNAVQKCPYFWELAFIRHLSGEHKAQALESGGLLHTMLKVFYTLKIKRPDLSHSRLIEVSTSVGRQESVQLQQELDTSENVIHHFTEYCKFREGDFWIPRHVEKSFITKLYEDEELTIWYEGVIDLVADTEAGEAVVDHKSSSRNMRSNVIELSNQFMGYCWALGINNAVINKIGFQKTVPPKERFVRVPISYSNEVLEAWRKNTIYWAQQMVWFVDNQTFPQNFTGCDKYSGCVFGEVCKNDPGEAREWYISTYFKEVDKWNPHTRDAELDEKIALLITGA